MYANNHACARRGLPRLALAAALMLAITACGKDEAAAPSADAGGAPAAVQSPATVDEAAAEQAARADALAGLGEDELRERGRAAYAQSRLYAPAGDNALEYYLALREKVPGDAAVASALTDLMPMLVIATEQARDREDFEESRRLAARDGLDQAVVTELMKRFALLLPDRELYRDAGLIPGPALRSLDALHIASALRLSADVVVTYDARQRLAARSVGLQTVSPGVPIEGLEPRPLGTDAGHFKVPDDFDDEVNDL